MSRHRADRDRRPRGCCFGARPRDPKREQMVLTEAEMRRRERMGLSGFSNSVC